MLLGQPPSHKLSTVISSVEFRYIDGYVAIFCDFVDDEMVVAGVVCFFSNKIHPFP